MSRDKPGESDMEALAGAFELYIKTTQSLEEAHRRLESRIESLDKELRDKNETLSLTTEHLNSILESMSDGVIAVDTEGIITTFNGAAASVLGYTAEETLGKSYREVFGKKFSEAPGRGVAELQGRDGNPVPVSERVSPIANSAGLRIGSVKVFQDLSEIEALREQVRRKDRLAALGEMAATVAHEIRNPLGGIRGFAALLERDIDSEDPRARLVAKILAGTKELDHVINELLEYTRPIQLDTKPVEYTALVQAALAYLDCGGKSIEIRNEIPGGVEVLVDSGKMRQVLLNILINAVQSIDSVGTIDLTLSENENDCSLIVSDTGCGIPEAELDRVFSPFFTTKEKGTGLGMAVASKIVESHGGTLEVASEAGKGATFTIRLPKGM